jgi:rubrerythrin
MTLLERLNRSYMDKLFSSPEGRAHVLAQAADSEASGESAIFEHALALVDDPELQRVIQRHRSDELRHEKLFRERLAAQNARYELREELRFVQRLDAALGGIVDRPIRDARGVLEAYSFLQVLEERACFSFELFIAAMSTSDPTSARVISEVLADERRHLKYCAAVARRYASSEEERLAVLERMREVEARVFQENQMANMRYTLARGFIGGPLETALWQAVRLAARALPLRPQTPAAREERRLRLAPV